ncbi:MAG: DNA methyltransferase, partial [Acidobacteria bacterium]
MTPAETYLKELYDIRALGAAQDETGYYVSLANLLNEVGRSLKPRVRCVMGLKNLGEGMPDGGLFTADQFPKGSPEKPLKGQVPARGAIEAKRVEDDSWVTAEGKQVTRYWTRYSQVLVTNYRDFVLVGRDGDGKPVRLESFRLAEDQKKFWAAAAHPRALADKVGARFQEYLLRVMRHAALLTSSEDVAWFLASYARDAKARIEGIGLPALATVRSALEEALGLKFEGEKGEHFFRSSLVQTLFYGVFSAWVLWAKQNPPTSKARFDWYTTARYLRVPMISKLFHMVSEPRELEALKLTEVLDWATVVLNRVDRRPFFDRFQETHAVQYFYEPFLEAFDPELRKELGVWYTPPEIVKYMVERVDTVLRQELGLADGLADKRVYVLDPCCGTGSYLVEVLDRIHRTLKEQGEDALIASDLKEAAQERVFGFEILPAPFVVSHLQLGLLLQNLGAPLSEKGKERVGVYLTNALTGWEPPKGPKRKLLFPELEEERDAAEHVKREVPILVILGNPPYNAFAGVSPAEEQGLVEPYKRGLKEWGITKNYLNDLYIRFFRLAERRIAEMTGRGLVCFISNFSYLGDPSFVVMRKRFLAEFDKLWFDCMNGDSRETGKLTPDGKPDPSVFSTQRNREGIRVGTAIGLVARVGAIHESP